MMQTFFLSFFLITIANEYSIDLLFSANEATEKQVQKKDIQKAIKNIPSRKIKQFKASRIKHISVPYQRMKKDGIAVTAHKQKRNNLIISKAHYPYQVNTVWLVLQDYSMLKHFLPKIDKSEILYEKGNEAMVRIDIKTPWPWPKLWTHLKLTKNENDHRFEWKNVKGNIKHFSGFVQLKSEPSKYYPDPKEQTYFYSESTLNLGHMIPRAVIRWAVNKYMPKILYKLAYRFRWQQVKQAREKATNDES